MTGVVLLGLALAGCGGDVGTGTPIETSSGGNFHLYVSNQSFDIDPVDIQVSSMVRRWSTALSKSNRNTLGFSSTWNWSQRNTRYGP